MSFTRILKDKLTPSKKYKTICYLSRQSDKLSQSDLELLFMLSTEKNNIAQVSGVLINTSNRFFQIIEGEKTVVDNLYKIIKNDKRHFELIELFDKRVDKRYFTDYNSAFRVALSSKDIKEIKAYLNKTAEYPFIGKVENLLRMLELSADLN